MRKKLLSIIAFVTIGAQVLSSPLFVLQTLALSIADTYTDASKINAGASSNYQITGGQAKLATLSATGGATSTFIGNVLATGGTSITYAGGYTIHTFLNSGTFTPSTNMNVEVLVIGGGGGGGNTGGGGGGGGYQYNASVPVSVSAYPVTVGAGGAGGSTPGAGGLNGGNSVFSSVTALGGGGGSTHGGTGGQNGGSGGGGAVRPAAPASTAGIGSQGYNGGIGRVDAGWVGNNSGGGGAGGAGGAGTNVSGSGAGGAGLLNTISGSTLYYAGGGGGSPVNGGLTAGAGGIGGGGAGGTNAVGSPGTPNTGGGGGGGSYSGVYYNGGMGGRGIIIIRYLSPASSQTYNIHTFTSSGTFTPNAPMNVEVLAIGGGGGGANTGGGGGAGGYVYRTLFPVTASAYPITIGGGGNGGSSPGAGGLNGGNSVFSSVTALGGGGGSTHGGTGGQNGGSGGGGAVRPAAPASTAGIGSQGYNGGVGYVDGGWVGNNSGGGGADNVGGAGAAWSGSGAGGAGIQNWVTGGSYYAGGGGGSPVNGGLTAGAGGIGGGGAGGTNAVGSPGTPNTGGGGGGGSYSGVYYNGGMGGSGMVKILYQANIYFSSGYITSTNLLTGEARLINSIDSFVYSASSLPSGTTASIQFSQNGSNWYNSAGTLNASNSLSTGVNNTISLSSMGWSGSNFYYKISMTSDGSGSPVIDDVSLNYTLNAAPSNPIVLTPASGSTGLELTPSIQLTATDTENDYLRYKIQLATDAGFTTGLQTFDQTINPQTGWSGQNAQTNTAYSSGSTATYTFQSNLIFGTTYYVRTYSIDPVGSALWSGVSTTLSFTVKAFNPPANCLIGAEVVTGPATISWTDNSMFEENYFLETSINGGAFTSTATLVPNTTSSIQPVGSGTYQYRIRAVASSQYTTYCTTAAVLFPLSPMQFEGVTMEGIIVR